MATAVSVSDQPGDALAYAKEIIQLIGTYLQTDRTLSGDEARVIPSLIHTCDYLAMQLLRDEFCSLSRDLLDKALQLTEPRVWVGVGEERERLRLRAVTLNNLGCYFKRFVG